MIKLILNWLKDRKAIALPELAWWMLGLFVLIVVVGGIMYLNKSASSGLEFIKDLFKFRGR
jgi:hypothetical protein